MKKINKILIGLDLSEMDDILIGYSIFFAKAIGAHHLSFVHNIKHRFPDAVLRQLKIMDQPLSDYISEDIQDNVESTMATKAIKLSFEVVVTEDNLTSNALAEVAANNQIDLAIMGKKVNYNGSGIVPAKLLRMFDCHLLFVPEMAYHQISKVLVPIDFSKSSITTLNMAFQLQDKLNIDVEGINVLSMPQRYFPYIPVDDVRESLRTEAKQEYKRFQKVYPEVNSRNFHCHLMPNQGRSIANVIGDFVFKGQYDFLIIGAKGRSALGALVVGSVTNGLINQAIYVPLLVVK